MDNVDFFQCLRSWIKKLSRKISSASFNLCSSLLGRFQCRAFYFHRSPDSRAQFISLVKLKTHIVTGVADGDLIRLVEQENIEALERVNKYAWSYTIRRKWRSFALQKESDEGKRCTRTCEQVSLDVKRTGKCDCKRENLRNLCRTSIWLMFIVPFEQQRWEFLDRKSQFKLCSAEMGTNFTELYIIFHILQSVIIISHVKAHGPPTNMTFESPISTTRVIFCLIPFLSNSFNWTSILKILSSILFMSLQMIYQFHSCSRSAFTDHTLETCGKARDGKNYILKIKCFVLLVALFISTARFRAHFKWPMVSLRNIVWDWHEIIIWPDA